MEKNELQALKDMVAAIEVETDLDMGGGSVGACTHCCNSSKGGF